MKSNESSFNTTNPNKDVKSNAGSIKTSNRTEVFSEWLKTGLGILFLIFFVPIIFSDAQKASIQRAEEAEKKEARCFKQGMLYSAEREREIVKTVVANLKEDFQALDRCLSISV